MATVSPVHFGISIPKYASNSKTSKQNSTNTTNVPVATKSICTNDGVVPNEKSALGVLLTSAMLCTVAIVNLIKAGR